MSFFLPFVSNLEEFMFNPYFVVILSESIFKILNSIIV
jgi:hypothetical protein